MRRDNHWRGGTSFLGLLAAALGGCGQTSTNQGDQGLDGGGIVAGDPIPLEDFVAGISAAQCEWVTPCCARLGLTVVETDCSTRLAAIDAGRYSSADPNHYTYDPELARDCLAATRELYDQAACNADNDTSAIEACNSVFQGKLEPGAPCTVDIECAASPGEEVGCVELV